MFNDQLMMLLAVFERAALMLMALFLLTQLHPFQHIVNKQHRRPIEIALISALFVFFAMFSTYTGIEVDGSLVNVRLIAIFSGGILFGPWVGIPCGIIAGLHRYIIDVDGPTSVACLTTSIVAGLISTWIHYRSPKENYAANGVIAGVLCEVSGMALIVMLSNNTMQAYHIVSSISVPMISATVSIGLIIRLVQGVENDKDLAAAEQAKLVLDIANKTLPQFRDYNPASFSKVGDILLAESNADAIVISDLHNIMTYSGIGSPRIVDNDDIRDMTQKVLTRGEPVSNNHLNVNGFHSVLIIPLWESNQVSGTLSIFYQEANSIRPALQEMAVGLSYLISTQMAASRVEHLKSMARKAEFSALQSKINPHFLFNSLNAISVLIRIKPNEARMLIGKLADFLRYNLNQADEFRDIHSEIQQVKDYVAIEQARFADKLTVKFDIEPVEAKIPCLLIQPLIENAILHGIQPLAQPGTVTLQIEHVADHVKITVRDTGVGIQPEVLNNFYNGDIDSKHIGLTNVHQRLMILYGQGLHIVRLRQGTEMSFSIPVSSKQEPQC